LLKQAKSTATTPLVVASVRDILVRKHDPEAHERRVLDIVNSLYDLVLVHSDERFQLLQDTFESAKSIGVPVVHTGYIVASHTTDKNSPHGNTRAVSMPFLSKGEPFILVSCGSGRLHAGRQLIHAALQAAPILERRFPHKLLICAGPLVSNEIFQEYQQIAAEVSNVHLIHDLPSMRSLLAQTSLSVSLGGYNTVMELLAARAQGLVFAAEPNGDNEQKMRVESLSAKGLLREIRAEDLMDGRLSELISEALTSPLPPADVRMNGAEESTCVLKHYLELRRYERFPDGSHEAGAISDTTSNRETTVLTRRQPSCA
jgi:predicted glycosyltransferase